MISTDEIKLHIKNLRDFAIHRIFSFDFNVLSSELQQIFTYIQSQLKAENLSIKDIRVIFKDAYESAKKFETNCKSIDDKAFIDVLFEAVVYGRQQLLEIHNKKNFSSLVSSYATVAQEVQLEVSQHATTRDIDTFETIISRDGYLSNIKYVDQDQEKSLHTFFTEKLKQNRTAVLPYLFNNKLTEGELFTKESFSQFINDDPGFIDEILKHSGEFQCINVCKNAIDREIIDAMKVFRPESKAKIDEFFLSILVFKLAEQSQEDSFNQASLIELIGKESLYVDALLKLNPKGFCKHVSSNFYKKVKEVKEDLINQIGYFIKSAQFSLWPNDIKSYMTLMSNEDLKSCLIKYEKFDFVLVNPQIFPLFSFVYKSKSTGETSFLFFKVQINSGSISFISIGQRGQDLFHYPDLPSVFGNVYRTVQISNQVERVRVIRLEKNFFQENTSLNDEQTQNIKRGLIEKAEKICPAQGYLLKAAASFKNAWLLVYKNPEMIVWLEMTSSKTTDPIIICNKMERAAAYMFLQDDKYAGIISCELEYLLIYNPNLENEEIIHNPNGQTINQLFKESEPLYAVYKNCQDEYIIENWQTKYDAFSDYLQLSEAVDRESFRDLYVAKLHQDKKQEEMEFDEDEADQSDREDNSDGEENSQGNSKWIQRIPYSDTDEEDEEPADDTDGESSTPTP